jgi:hypothetical protein
MRLQARPVCASGYNRKRSAPACLSRVVRCMRTLRLSLCVTILTLLCGCGGVSEPTDAPTLADCYATEFASSPPARVRNLRAKQVIVGDAGGAWLRFETDSNTLSQITSNRFLPSNATDFEIYGSPNGGNTPSWWHPVPEALGEFYINKQWRPGSNYSIAVLAYDRSNHLVYFHHGISF